MSIFYDPGGGREAARAVGLSFLATVAVSVAAGCAIIYPTFGAFLAGAIVFCSLWAMIYGVFFFRYD